MGVRFGFSRVWSDSEKGTFSGEGDLPASPGFGRPLSQPRPEASAFLISEVSGLRATEALGHAQRHLAWPELLPETPLTISPLLEEVLRVRDERGSELVAAQRGLSTAKGHRAGRQSPGGGAWLGDGAPQVLSLREGGARRPSSPGNLSGQHAGGGSHGAHSCTQEAGRLSPLEKGALLPCPSGRRESRPALGILTAQQPNKTRSPRRPLLPAC